MLEEDTKQRLEEIGKRVSRECEHLEYHDANLCQRDREFLYELVDELLSADYYDSLSE